MKGNDIKPGKHMVCIDFEKDPPEPGKKHEILRVIVGPTQELVDDFEAVQKFVKDSNRAPRGSCDNGEADVVFVKDGGNGKAVEDYVVKDALVGITQIATTSRKFPEILIFAQKFYDFGPANRKAFAKLFC